MADIRAFIVDSRGLGAFSDVLPALINERYRTEYFSSRLDQQKMNKLAAGTLLACFAGIGPDEKLFRNESGKPYADGKDHFSISHSDHFTVLALSEDEPVGIDIERVGRVTARIIRKVSRYETGSASETELACEWTKVEAALKQKGTGFYSDPLKLDIDALVYSTCFYEGYCITCASEKPHVFSLDLVNTFVEDNIIKYTSENIFRKEIET